MSSVVSSSPVIRGFRCLSTLLLYLPLYFAISSLTVGMLRSRCIVSLETYQGASIRDLRVFDRKRWSISVLELLASCLLMDVFAGVERRIAFIMLVFRYSVAASISSLVFSEVEAEVVCVKTSLKSCQLVCWL